MFAVCVFIIGGVIGTFMSLRYLEIKRQTEGHNLTVRGRLVIAILCGIALGLFMVLVEGMWWNCDSGTCHLVWGY